MFPKARSSGKPKFASMTKATTVKASASKVQAKGQFGNPSGKTVSSPPSLLNGKGTGIGKSKAYKGTY